MFFVMITSGTQLVPSFEIDDGRQKCTTPVISLVWNVYVCVGFCFFVCFVVCFNVLGVLGVSLALLVMGNLKI